MTTLRRRGEAREEGQIAVLIIGFVVLALLLATAVMAVSAVYLEYKKLLSLADGAALAAADTFMVGDMGTGTRPGPTLVDERVRSGAYSYLSGTDASSHHDRLALAAGTGSEPGGTAVVVLTAVAHPPVISFLLPDGILVEARSVARSSLTQ
ncbi:pilus assembly protein TadG-related protein [Paenarthrobacter sp. YAF11_1]|uniref:pilus assembly protein TadG-related protein n=1 Tax=Paenarthrobacter sp. YAF11_1 TaxID=3233074 RepID=UPI003F9A085F